MTRPTIALCMITKNEESNLPRLLESVDGCFDEIHITDTGSTDRTVDIAKALGCHVHHFDWINDFGAARNYSFSHAKTDYIMWIDGDDVLANKEAFKLWRDNAMETANYWLANYHYSLDKNGKPACTFLRERVVRNLPAFKWKYFIHEGILPDPIEIAKDPKLATSNAVSSWSIMHLRTDEDMKKDRSRNVSIFKEKLEKGVVLDGRMTFYYAKELFESQYPKEAIEWFYKALKFGPKDLEHHDRILCYQYIIYSLNHTDDLRRKMGNMDGEDLAQSVSLAHQGLVVDPNRAEFYCLIGDAYLKLAMNAKEQEKMGYFMKAIPAFRAARGCLNQGSSSTGMSSALFTFSDAYNDYPSMQLAKIFIMFGRLDEAKEEYSRIKNKEHQDVVPIGNELNRINAINFQTTSPVDCDDIVISCPPGPSMYEWDEEVYQKKGIGGSETAAVEMARNLHKVTGRTVKVFNARSTDLTVDGVEYISNVKLNDYFAKFKPKAHIAWRHSIKITNAPTYLWAHDIMIPGFEDTSKYEKVLCLSPWQKDYIRAMYNIPEDKITITRNGLSPDKFRTLDTNNKVKGKVIFPSSPDRGLKQAILACDQIIKEIPELTLHVFYGFDNLEKMGRVDLVTQLKQMISERPWVVYHGNTEQKELMRHFAEAELWLYPADWYETFCITLFEVLAAKCYPVLRPVGALKNYAVPFAEKGMASLVEMPLEDPNFITKLAEEGTRALKEQKWKNVQLNINEWSWESLAREWAFNMDLESIAIPTYAEVVPVEEVEYGSLTF